MLTAGCRCLHDELKYSSCFILCFSIWLFLPYVTFYYKMRIVSRVPVLHSEMRKHEEKNHNCTGYMVFLTKLSSTSPRGVGGEPSNFLTFLFYYSIYMHLPYIRTDVLCKGTVFSNFTLNWFLPESYKEYINIFIGGTTATQLSQLLISAHGERTTFYNVKWNVSWFFSMHF